MPERSQIVKFKALLKALVMAYIVEEIILPGIILSSVDCNRADHLRTAGSVPPSLFTVLDVAVIIADPFRSVKPPKSRILPDVGRDVELGASDLFPRDSVGNKMDKRTVVVIAELRLYKFVAVHVVIEIVNRLVVNAAIGRDGILHGSAPGSMPPFFLSLTDIIEVILLPVRTALSSDRCIFIKI